MQNEKPKADQRPKRLADVPLRFPPPAGTRFYVCFRGDLYQEFPPYDQMPTAIADSPQAALDQVLNDGKGPIDPRLRCANVTWFDHNGNPRSLYFWLTPDQE